MTEKEKMIAGKMYNANDATLAMDRDACKTLCNAYNQLLPAQKAEKIQLLQQLLKKWGNNLVMEPNIWFDYGYNIEIGENFYANHNLVILDGGAVKFGHNVFVGPNCNFYTVNHPTKYKERNTADEYAMPITVGNNVWFGGNVTVLPGVTVGSGCVIGAGSVVVKNIPENTLAAGNPCRVIRSIEND